ncbi:MAG: 50S ribosomal protein L9 [candidate division Zixibacteria bacterium]|nr:50S ribosomal protein L9 [Candidatus Tariuqbacter arcticus]
MKIILQKDFASLGTVEDIVIVKDGYARNYLIPQGIAVKADKSALKVLAENKRVAEFRRNRERRSAEKLAEQLTQTILIAKVQTGEEDRVFGSVTSQDIAELLKKKGIEIDRRKIELEEPIKALGKYRISLRLHQEVTVSVRLNVEKK